MSQELPDRDYWLLVIVHLSERVDGITRLQKLAFLTNELVPNMNRVGFYDDWKPGKYGPYSPSLGNDVDALVTRGLVDKEVVESSAGYAMDAFKVTPQGEKEAMAIEERQSKLAEMIKKSVVQKYARAPLMSLLHDVYYMAPQYTVESEVAGTVFGIPRRQE